MTIIDANGEAFRPLATITLLRDGVQAFVSKEMILETLEEFALSDSSYILERMRDLARASRRNRELDRWRKWAADLGQADAQNRLRARTLEELLRALGLAEEEAQEFSADPRTQALLKGYSEAYARAITNPGASFYRPWGDLLPQ
jgi:hypothetical protein